MTSIRRMITITSPQCKKLHANRTSRSSAPTASRWCHFGLETADYSAAAKPAVAVAAALGIAAAAVAVALEVAAAAAAAAPAVASAAAAEC